MSCVTLLREDSWNLVCAVLWILPHVPLHFADFALIPFAVISLSLGYNCMSNPVSLPRESPSLGVILGIPHSSSSHFSILSAGVAHHSHHCDVHDMPSHPPTAPFPFVTSLNPSSCSGSRSHPRSSQRPLIVTFLSPLILPSLWSLTSFLLFLIF